MRIGVIRDWDARWYADKNYVELLHEDLKVRKFVKAKLFESGVSEIITERTGNTKLRVTIHTARPGIVIGAKGSETLCLHYTILYERYQRQPDVRKLQS
mgnify:CR=1 FL=1